MAGGSMINERNLGDLRQQHHQRKYQLSQDTYGMLNVDNPNMPNNMVGPPGANTLNPLLQPNLQQQQKPGIIPGADRNNTIVQ